MRKKDNVDVFGSYTQDGSAVEATKVVIFRSEAPVVVGKILNVNLDDQTVIVEDEDTGETWTVSSGGALVSEQDGGFGPGGGLAGSPTGQGGGLPRGFGDLANGAIVAVFGEVGNELTLTATRIVILFGGAVQEASQFSGQVEFFDAFNGRLNLQSPQPIRVRPDAEITLPDGTQLTSLLELREFIFDIAGAILRIDIETADGEIWANSIAVILPPDGPGRDPVEADQDQILVEIRDPRQIQDFDSSIALLGLPPVDVTRNTQLLFPDGSEASPENLTPGTRVDISGMATTRGRETTVTAEVVQISGGTPFRDEGLVASVDLDARLVTLAAPPPEPISPRVRIGDEQGRIITLEELSNILEDDPTRILVFELNKFGPGVIRLELTDPDRPKPPRPGEFQVLGGDVSFETDEDGQLLMMIVAPLPVQVPESAVIEGDAADLSDLEGKRIIVDGEVLAGSRVAQRVLVVGAIDRILLEFQVGDFDAEGIENDVLITALDQDGNELEIPLRLFLDRLPPQDIESGAVINNLRPGRHDVKVEAPSLPEVQARQGFVIRATESTFSVVTTDPVDGSVDVTSGDTEIRITFSGPVQQIGQFINASVIVRPDPTEGVHRDLMSLEDGTTLVVPVVLDEDMTYTITVAGAVGERNEALTRPVLVTFSTGGILDPPGTISGLIELSAIFAAKQTTEPVEFISGDVIAVDSNGAEAGWGIVEADGRFEVSLREGDYKLFILIETTEGPASGFLDADGDGAPDGVQVASGETTGGVMVSVEEPEPVDATKEDVVLADVAPYTGEGSPQSSVFLDPYTVELETDNEEDAGKLSLAVFIDGVEGLSSYDVLMQFDPAAFTFLEVVKSSDQESNILDERGGFALGIVNPDANSVNWSVVLLGATNAQKGQGGGLLGVFKFMVNESFFGTSSVITPQLVLKVDEGTLVLQPFVGAQAEGGGLNKQIRASSESESFEVGGTDGVKINVQLLDLDGLAFGDDNTSEVTIAVIEGDAKVNGGQSATLTVVDGRGEATLTADAEGTIQIRASTEGASSAVVVVEATSPPEIGEGPVGPMALDLNTVETGDQGLRKTEVPFAAGTQVGVELVATEGAGELSGYQASIIYDSERLEYVGFNVGALFEGGFVIPTISGGVIRIAVAFLGSNTTSQESGSLGLITFKVLDEREARVTLVSGQFAAGGAPDRLTIGSGGAIVGIGGDAGFSLTPQVGDGTWSLDLDSAIGDQGAVELNGVSANQEFTVELINNQAVSPALGGDFTLQFDPEKVEPQTTSITGIAGQLGTPAIKGNTIRFTLAGLSGVAVEAGYVGEITFKTLDDFDGETEIILTKAAIGDATTFANVESEPNTSVVIRSGGSAAGPTPDFDGNGEIGFRDFIMFAQKYGSVEGDDRFDPIFDLDSNDEVGFRDFILFAQVYGKPASAYVPPSGKLVLSKATDPVGANKDAVMSLMPLSSGTSDYLVLALRLHGAVDVTGFGVRLKYDVNAMKWMGADGILTSRFTKDDRVAVQREESLNLVLLADIFESEQTIKGEGDLVRLRFLVTDKTVAGRVEILQAQVSDGLGRVNSLLGPRLEDSRTLPTEYSLGPNYPNPFNPETVIPFAVPNPGEVRLVVYNIIGQKVRVLGRGSYEPGLYKVVWDGRDESGHPLSSGIYLIQMSADGFYSVQKMLLLK